MTDNTNQTQALSDFIRSMVRPFIILWSLAVYGLCILRGTAVPDLLAFLITAIVIEYFGERALLRLKDSGKGG